MALALALDRDRAASVAALFGVATYGIGASVSALITQLPSLGGVSLLSAIACVLALALLALHLANVPGRPRP